MTKSIGGGFAQTAMKLQQAIGQRFTHRKMRNQGREYKEGGVVGEGAQVVGIAEEEAHRPHQEGGAQVDGEAGEEPHLVQVEEEQPRMSDEGLSQLSDEGLSQLSDEGLSQLSEEGLSLLSDEGQSQLSDEGLSQLSDEGLPQLQDEGLQFQLLKGPKAVALQEEQGAQENVFGVESQRQSRRRRRIPRHGIKYIQHWTLQG